MKNSNENISLEEGGGGLLSEKLINSIRKKINAGNIWENTGDDSAVYTIGKNKIVFTTDAFIVDPIFFPGGDIGKIAFCGTVNDLAVMGADPIGLSLSLVIEEGFPRKDLEKIIQSISFLSKKYKIPIVTVDTKVTEKGKIDRIEITTSGVGLADEIIDNSGNKVGDLVIASGNLGEHGVALLASRFSYQTKIKSDCQPIIKELKDIRKFITSAKDPTRGGLAAILNEMAQKSRTKIILEENRLSFHKETLAISGLLGIDKFSLPSEGRFIATVSPKYGKKVLEILQKYNKEARIIGEVKKGRGVFLKTNLGAMIQIETPRGKLIPRIC